MTSWSLRPASRARKAPAVWIPSCEFPARRMTASLIFSGRRSARSEGGLQVDGTEGGLPLAAVAVGDAGLSAVADFCIAVTSGFTGSPMGGIYAVLNLTKQALGTSASTTQRARRLRVRGRGRFPSRKETRRVPARKLEEARC